LSLLACAWVSQNALEILVWAMSSWGSYPKALCTRPLPLLPLFEVWTMSSPLKEALHPFLNWLPAFLQFLLLTLIIILDPCLLTLGLDPLTGHCEDLPCRNEAEHPSPPFMLQPPVHRCPGAQ
jgi:hypothetical protein